MFDITGMLCTCGKKLTYKGIDNGCHVLICTHCKQDKGYRIPVNDPRTLISPCELQWAKVKCKDCGRSILEDQAARTFKEEGRALCISCHG